MGSDNKMIGGKVREGRRNKRREISGNEGKIGEIMQGK